MVKIPIFPFGQGIFVHIPLFFSHRSMVLIPKKSSSILFYNSRNQIFFVKRNGKTKFMKNAYVFPGGVSESCDGDLTRYSKLFRQFASKSNHQLLLSLSPSEFKSRICGIRESLEESGVCLFESRIHQTIPIQRILREYRAKIHEDAREMINLCENLQVVPDIGRLIPFAQWITPHQESRRYHTKFYVVKLTNEILMEEMIHDGSELTESEWLSPNEALIKFQQKDIYLPPPTWMILTELSSHSTWEELCTYILSHRSLDPIQPNFLKEQGIIALPGDELHHDFDVHNNHGYYNRIEVHDKFRYTLNQQSKL